jgi:hypothetical protein
LDPASSGREARGAAPAGRPALLTAGATRPTTRCPTRAKSQPLLLLHPDGAPTTSTTTTNFAIHELFLGDTDFDGKADPTAWDRLGYNVVHHAVITLQHTSSAHAAGGVISGVLYTNEVVSALKSWAVRIAPSLCEGATLDSLFEALEASQDILSDGTNPPNVRCNAISIGLGFTADAIAQPTSIVCPAADRNPCRPDASVPLCEGGMIVLDSGAHD